MFKDCYKLLEISIYEDSIDINNKKLYESEDLYNNIDYYEDIYDNIQNNLNYDYIYPNYSAIARSTTFKNATHISDIRSIPF